MLRNLALERAVIHRAILNEVLSLNAQEFVFRLRHDRVPAPQ